MGRSLSHSPEERLGSEGRALGCPGAQRLGARGSSGREDWTRTWSLWGRRSPRGDARSS